jgi:predicted PurR-regulated permease PerM
MIKRIKNTLFLVSFFTFIFFLISFYFSDENIKQINKSRFNYLNKLDKYILDLPLLENDTNNIIEYKNDIENNNKNKKYNLFWGLIEK